MDGRGAPRVPLGLLYALLALLVGWAGVYRVAVTADLYAILVTPREVASPPFLTGWPDDSIDFVAMDIAEHTRPVLAIGDRIDTIDGRPATPTDVVRTIHAARPGATLRVEATRTSKDGNASTFASEVRLRSVAEGERERSNRLLTAVLGLFLPWVCLLTGVWVAVVRPRDPMAWLVLTLLLWLLGRR